MCMDQERVDAVDRQKRSSCDARSRGMGVHTLAHEV